MGFVFLWREAPMPPLEGEVVKRQRNRRGLYVNRAVQENPSVSPFGLPAPLSGAPRALRAGAGAFNRVLAKIRGYGRILSAPTVGMCKYF